MPAFESVQHHHVAVLDREERDGLTGQLSQRRQMRPRDFTRGHRSRRRAGQNGESGGDAPMARIAGLGHQPTGFGQRGARSLNGCLRNPEATGNGAQPDRLQLRYRLEDQ